MGQDDAAIGLRALTLPPPCWLICKNVGSSRPFPAYAKCADVVDRDGIKWIGSHADYDKIDVKKVQHGK